MTDVEQIDYFDSLRHDDRADDMVVCQHCSHRMPFWLLNEWPYCRECGERVWE